MSMIQLIIFDFGGVLGSDADDWEKTFSEILSRTGLTAEELDTLWSLHWDKMRTGVYDLDVFIKAVVKMSKNKVSVQELLAIYKECILLNKESFDVAEKLKAKGYALAVLANESRTGMGFKTEKSELAGIFDKIYCSADIGFAKPDNRTFIRVLEDFKKTPQEALLIDDRNKNTEAVIRLGMSAILYENNKQLYAEMFARGLLAEFKLPTQFSVW